MFFPDDPFVAFLQSRKGCRAYLKPYRGNSGDELISMGNEILLKELGIEQVVDPRKADLILWPGGNPAMWQEHLAGWQDCWKQFPNTEFVVAPATFQGSVQDWRTPLETTRARIGGVFARDTVSFRELQSLKLSGGAVIGLGHDPAFHLRNSEWVARHREAATSEYILASFRGDHESVFAKPVWGGKLSGIWPLSSVAFRLANRRQEQAVEQRLRQIRQISGTKAEIMAVDAPLMSFQLFVELVRRADQVHTDRLHCMILSLLLGKKVFAYPTAYGKLEGVYEQSIKSWAEVQFVRA